MRLITYANDINALGAAKEAGLEEVIICPKFLCRFGGVDRESAEALADEASNLGLRPVMEWDVLSCEKDIISLKDELSKIKFDKFSSIRVQDPGALEWALENTSLPIQLILETGNHNLEGLKAYRDYVGDRLERMVLSIELTLEKLSSYREELGVPVEFLLMGRILLFYTPRNLLSSMLPEEDEARARPQLSAVGESEESPHKGFPVLENQHGTFMFHMKRQFLFEHLNDLSFLDFGRVDLRFDDDLDSLFNASKVAGGEMGPSQFKSLYPYDSIKGFYKVNKSDVLFKKLKNSRVQRKDEGYVGEILEIKKGVHQVLRLKGLANIQKGQRLKFITPEGKVLEAPLVELKNIRGENLEMAEPENVVMMNYLGGVWVKSQVYLADSK